MSVQKLRTPKGLSWLSLAAGTLSRNLDLIFLQQIRRIYCWQIADASASPTKLIISDHPVTVYNRALSFPKIPSGLDSHCKAESSHH
jgi:hypothetical protein